MTQTDSVCGAHFAVGDDETPHPPVRWRGRLPLEADGVSKRTGDPTFRSTAYDYVGHAFALLTPLHPRIAIETGKIGRIVVHDPVHAQRLARAVKRKLG